MLKRLGYKNLDLSDACMLENDMHVKRVIEQVTGFLLSNPMKIKPLEPFIKEYFLKDEESEEYLQRFLRILILKLLPKLLVFGFVSYRHDPESLFNIIPVDYENGEMLYKVNAKTHKIEFAWVWEKQLESDITQGKNLMGDQIDKTVKHYVWDYPTHKGKLKSALSEFIKEKKEITLLNSFAMEIERVKKANPFYMQRKLPDLTSERYEVFQNHTMFMNQNSERIDDRNKRFMTMHNMRRNLDTWDSRWKERTKENILQYFQMKTFFSFNPTEYKPKGSKKGTGAMVPTAGELIEPKFTNKHLKEYGVHYTNKLSEYKENLSLAFGFGMSTKNRQLKDNVRMVGFMLRPTIARIQLICESLLNEIVNNVYMDVFKKQIQEIHQKNGDDESKLAYYLGFLALFKIELDPIQYITSEELKILQMYKIPLRSLIKMVLGSEFLYICDELEDEGQEEEEEQTTERAEKTPSE